MKKELPDRWGFNGLTHLLKELYRNIVVGLS